MTPLNQPDAPLSSAIHSKPLAGNMLSRGLDRFVILIGRLAALVWIFLVINICVSVFIRYVMGSGSVFLEELQWHFFAVGVAISLSYTMSENGHIRVDVLSVNFRPRTKLWIEIIGLLFLLLPYCVFVLWYSYDFVMNSFTRNEVSLAPGGVPYRWIIKSFLPISFLLLAISGVACLIRSIAGLRALTSRKIA